MEGQQAGEQGLGEHLASPAVQALLSSLEGRLRRQQEENSRQEQHAARLEVSTRLRQQQLEAARRGAAGAASVLVSALSFGELLGG